MLLKIRSDNLINHGFKGDVVLKFYLYVFLSVKYDVLLKMDITYMLEKNVGVKL